MGTATQATRIAANTWLTVLLAIGTSNLYAQEHGAHEHGAEEVAKQGKPAHVRTSDEQNGAATAPVHAPQPDLRPLFAWNFVMSGNARFVAARREKARRQSNKLIAPSVTMSHHGAGKDEQGHAETQPARPAGSGKYVCCVITCADGETEIAPMLGLANQDVLVLRLAGPFVNAEAIALVERTIKEHRLCLVLVLGHEQCDSLRLDRQGPEDALDRRVAALRGHLGRTGQTLAQRLVETQRELMLLSSKILHTRTRKDKLRIVPGVINQRSGAIAWLHRKAQQLPLSPVK